MGHAQVNKINQPEAPRYIGKRLKATHVHVNYGETDEHLLPFYGSIDWREVMNALKDIDYEEDFAYEVHRFFDVLPDGEFRDDLLKFAYKLGQYLLSL
ncbi:MAG TPA: hypothetical protein GXX49_07275 [Clostridiaceae bacterium]|nr:hypothetical protein [Clostridiaceae bacterium]